MIDYIILPMIMGYFASILLLAYAAQVVLRKLGVE